MCFHLQQPYMEFSVGSTYFTYEAASCILITLFKERKNWHHDLKNKIKSLKLGVVHMNSCTFSKAFVHL